MAGRFDDTLRIRQPDLNPELYPAIRPFQPEIRFVRRAYPLGEAEIRLVEQCQGQQPRNQPLLGFGGMPGNGRLKCFVYTPVDVGQLDRGPVYG